MSWETQHKSRNPADGIIRPFTACNDILMRYVYQVDPQYETWYILVGVHLILICCCPSTLFSVDGIFMHFCWGTMVSRPLCMFPIWDMAHRWGVPNSHLLVYYETWYIQSVPISHLLCNLDMCHVAERRQCELPLLSFLRIAQIASSRWLMNPLCRPPCCTMHQPKENHMTETNRGRAVPLLSS